MSRERIQTAAKRGNRAEPNARCRPPQHVIKRTGNVTRTIHASKPVSGLTALTVASQRPEYLPMSGPGFSPSNAPSLVFFSPASTCSLRPSVGATLRAAVAVQIVCPDDLSLNHKNNYAFDPRIKYGAGASTRWREKLSAIITLLGENPEPGHSGNVRDQADHRCGGSAGIVRENSPGFPLIHPAILPDGNLYTAINYKQFTGRCNKKLNHAGS